MYIVCCLLTLLLFWILNPKSTGENATNDVDEQQPIAPTSSSNTRLSSYETWCVTDQELFEASLLLRRFTFHDLMLATRTFKVENFHDEEGFGILLKGWINPYGNYAARPGTGIPIAVKSLNFNEFQHPKEWLVCHHYNPFYIYFFICLLFILFSPFFYYANYIDMSSRFHSIFLTPFVLNILHSFQKGNLMCILMNRVHNIKILLGKVLVRNLLLFFIYIMLYFTYLLLYILLIKKLIFSVFMYICRMKLFILVNSII